jgi:outer membrane lipoprotein-sorting protein
MANDQNLGASTRRSRLLSSPGVRWAVPAGAVALIAGGVAFTTANADAAAQLPPKTAAQLLVDVAKSPTHPLSGTVVETAKLGLPELPGQAAGTSLQSLITGSHTARVWYGTDAKARISLIGDLAETDVVRNGTDMWLWSSSTNQATHYRLPAHEAGAESKAPAVPPTLKDPASAAKQALAAINPSTKVAVDGTGHVAGRPVYELRLSPRDGRSLIASVRIAIDGATSVPLRVQVFAKGATDPAFETGFTSVQFEQPAASIFRFTPPKGAKVVQGGSPDSESGAGRASALGQARVPEHSTVKVPGKGPGKVPVKVPAQGTENVVGSGWTAVAILPDVNVASLSQDQTAGALLRATSAVTLPNGTSGRLLRTPLLSVLIVGNTAYVGAVDPALVEQVAATHPTTSTNR